MKIIIKSHSLRITNSKTITKERTCNCVDKAGYPPSQNCLINSIIYKAVLTSTNPCYKRKYTLTQLKLHSRCDNQTIKGR